MARYKQIGCPPPVPADDQSKQSLPGGFDLALNYPFDHRVNLSSLDVRYRDDATDASAFPPDTLIDVVRSDYLQGIR